MSEKPTDEELARFHRYFAVESNNHAWQSTLAPAEEREPLDILRHAYVSAYHWSVVGTEVNEFRANILLAHAWASRMLALNSFTSVPTTDQWYAET